MSKQLRVGTWGAALLILLLSTAGCGGGSFIGRRYDNFTAYYNTFYNARRSFQEGVKALEQNDTPVDRRTYISVFTAPGRATNAQTFQNAIDKSADVLRDHPNSKWVDDALMLIGQSYFYQENYVGAEQKFREVIDLGSALEDEARLWLARTLIAAGAYDEARDHLIVSLSLEDLSRRWAPQLHLALGQLYVRQQSYADAAEQLTLGLEEVRDNDLEARGWFLLGQVRETLEQYEQAVAAYERVRRAHPRYELSYAADVSAIRVRGLYLDAERALRDLRRMERDDKNFANRYELAYLRARIYQAQGRAGQAQQLYKEILYDPEAQIGDLRGRIHYALGQFYEDVRGDFLKAAAHYDTARTNLTGRTAANQQELQYAPEAITDIEQRARTFATFADARQNVARMDSLLELGSLDPEAFAERILELRRQLAIEMARQQREVERRQAQRSFQDAAAQAGQDYGPSQNEDTGTAGFLFHRDPIRVQENRLSFIDRWGERPHVPNWRRMEAVFAAQSTRGDGAGGLTDDLGDPASQMGQNPLPQLDYSAVPRDSLSRARMRAERALARYNLGNVLFLSMNMPDSAASWYRLVITEDAEEDVAQRAYYALAEVQRSLGDTAAADEIYQQVLRDFPESDFAGRVREQLGIREDVPSDSLALARQDYEEAYARWQRGYHYDALNRMVGVAAKHRHTEVAPKALLAAARIYLEWASEDSLDLTEPLPLTLSDSVLARAGLFDVSFDFADLASGSPDGQGQVWAADSTANDSTLTRPNAGQIRAGEESAVGGATGQQPRVRLEPDGQGSPGGDHDSIPSDEELALRSPDEELALRSPDEVRGAGADTVSADELLARERRAMADRSDETELADSLAADVGTSGDSLATASAVSDDSLAAVSRVPGDSLAAVPGIFADSLAGITRTSGDSLAAAPGMPVDSLAALLNVPADSLAGAAGVSADSLAELVGISTDSLAALTGISTDSLNALAGTSADSPTAASVPEDAIFLTTLYASVRQYYPSTPYAGHAEAMLEVLATQQSEQESADASSTTGIPSAANGSAPPGMPGDTPPAEDSTSTTAELMVTSADSMQVWDKTTPEAPDSVATDLVADSAAVVAEGRLQENRDSTSLAVQRRASDSTDADSTRLPVTTAGTDTTSSGAARQEAQTGIPSGEAAIRGEGGIRQELGGYTLMIGMHVRREPMEALAGKYADSGFRTDVIAEQVGSTELYRAVVGQFSTREEAGRAMSRYASEFEERLEITSLTNPSSSATGMR